MKLRAFRNFLAAGVLLVGAFSAPALAEQPLQPPPVTQFMLDNGLEVVVIPDRRAPVVTQMLWYKAVAPTRRPASPASPISSNI